GGPHPGDQQAGRVPAPGRDPLSEQGGPSPDVAGPDGKQAVGLPPRNVGRAGGADPFNHVFPDPFEAGHQAWLDAIARAEPVRAPFRIGPADGLTGPERELAEELIPILNEAHDNISAAARALLSKRPLWDLQTGGNLQNHVFTWVELRLRPGFE